MLDKIPLNFALMRHWENWIIIILMLIVASIGLDMLATAILPEHDPAVAA